MLENSNFDITMFWSINTHRSRIWDRTPLHQACLACSVWSEVMACSVFSRDQISCEWGSYLLYLCLGHSSVLFFLNSSCWIHPAPGMVVWRHHYYMLAINGVICEMCERSSLSKERDPVYFIPIWTYLNPKQAMKLLCIFCVTKNHNTVLLSQSSSSPVSVSAYSMDITLFYK